MSDPLFTISWDYDRDRTIVMRVGHSLHHSVGVARA